jgi:hypothetical protein
MARYFGKIGYGIDVDQGGDVWKTVITEREYYGDVTRNYRRLQEGEKINNDLTTSTQLSIMSDTYANDHFSAIRYAEWKGVRWKVTSVSEAHPRLILELGGKYNGQTPS